MAASPGACEHGQRRRVERMRTLPGTQRVLMQCCGHCHTCDAGTTPLPESALLSLVASHRTGFTSTNNSGVLLSSGLRRILDGEEDGLCPCYLILRGETTSSGIVKQCSCGLWPSVLTWLQNEPPKPRGKQAFAFTLPFCGWTMV